MDDFYLVSGIAHLNAYESSEFSDPPVPDFSVVARNVFGTEGRTPCLKLTTTYLTGAWWINMVYVLVSLPSK